MPRQRVTVAIRKGDRYLLLQRGPTDPKHPGLWEFPGGRPEGKETLDAAAKREAEEETSLQVAALRFLGEWTRPDQSAHTEFFFASKWTGTPKVSSEHASLRWLSLDEILNHDSTTRIGIDTLTCARIIASAKTARW